MNESRVVVINNSINNYFAFTFHSIECLIVNAIPVSIQVLTPEKNTGNFVESFQ